MSQPTETVIDVGGVAVTQIEGGQGKPVLMLHDELGFPGWMQWNKELSKEHRFLIPLQPGFGRTPRVEWFWDYRDVAAFYNQMLRQTQDEPIDIIGFSAGGYVAAEMASACPDLVDRLVLVAPLGLRPPDGEIFDFLAATARTHVALTMERHDVPEAGRIYGGDMSAEQFELFELARAETSRLGWEPFMYGKSLLPRLQAVQTPTLLIWGDADRILPRSAVATYADALANSTLEVVPDVGHRPEIENPTMFIKLIADFIDPQTHAARRS